MLSSRRRHIYNIYLNLLINQEKHNGKELFSEELREMVLRNVADGAEQPQRKLQRP